MCKIRLSHVLCLLLVAATAVALDVSTCSASPSSFGEIPTFLHSSEAALETLAVALPASVSTVSLWSATEQRRVDVAAFFVTLFLDGVADEWRLEVWGAELLDPSDTRGAVSWITLGSANVSPSLLHLHAAFVAADAVTAVARLGVVASDALGSRTTVGIAQLGLVIAADLQLFDELTLSRSFLMVQASNAAAVPLRTAACVFYTPRTLVLCFFGASTSSGAAAVPVVHVLEVAELLSTAGAAGGVMNLAWGFVAAPSQSFVSARSRPGCAADPSNSVGVVCMGGFSPETGEPIQSLLLFEPFPRGAPGALSCDVTTAVCSGGVWTDLGGVLRAASAPPLGDIAPVFIPIRDPANETPLRYDFAALLGTDSQHATRGTGLPTSAWLLTPTLSRSAASLLQRASSAEVAAAPVLARILALPSAQLAVGRVSGTSTRSIVALSIVGASTVVWTSPIESGTGRPLLSAARVVVNTSEADSSGWWWGRSSVPPPRGLWGHSVVPAFGGVAVLFGAQRRRGASADILSMAMHIALLPEVKWLRVSAFSVEAMAGATAPRVGASCLVIDDIAVSSAPSLWCIGGFAVRAAMRVVVVATADVLQCTPPSVAIARGRRSAARTSTDLGFVCRSRSSASSALAGEQTSGMPPRAFHSCVHRRGSTTVVCAGGLSLSTGPIEAHVIDGGRLVVSRVREAVAGGATLLTDVWLLDLRAARWHRVVGSDLAEGQVEPVMMFLTGAAGALGGSLVICCGRVLSVAGAESKAVVLSFVDGQPLAQNGTYFAPQTISALLADTGTTLAVGATADTIAVWELISGTSGSVVLSASPTGSSLIGLGALLRESVAIMESMRVAAARGLDTFGPRGDLASLVVERTSTGTMAAVGGQLLWLPPMGPATLWNCGGTRCSDASATTGCVLCGPLFVPNAAMDGCVAASPSASSSFNALHDAAQLSTSALFNATVASLGLKAIEAHSAPLTAPAPTFAVSSRSGLDSYMADTVLSWIPWWGPQLAAAAVMSLALLLMLMCVCAQYASRRRVLRRHPKDIIARWSDEFRRVSADGLTVNVNELERALQDLFPRLESDSRGHASESSTSSDSRTPSDDGSDNNDGNHAGGAAAAAQVSARGKPPGYATGRRFLRGRMTGLRELFLLFDRRGLGLLDLVQFVQCCEYVQAVVAEERRYRTERRNYRQRVFVEAGGGVPAADKYLRNATFDVSIDENDPEQERRRRLDEVKRKLRERNQEDGQVYVRERRKKKKKEGEAIRRIYPASTAGRLGLFQLDFFSVDHTTGVRVGEALRYSRTNAGGCWTVLLITGVVLMTGFLLIEHFAERVPSRSIRPLDGAPPSAVSGDDERVMHLGDLTLTIEIWPALASLAASNTVCVNIETLAFPQQVNGDGSPSIFSPRSPSLASWRLTCRSDAQHTTITAACASCNVSLAAAASNPIERIWLRILPAVVNAWPSRIAVALETRVGLDDITSRVSATAIAPAGWRLAGPISVDATFVPQAVDVHHVAIWPVLPTGTGAEPLWVRFGSTVDLVPDLPVGATLTADVDLSLRVNLSILRDASGAPSMYETRTSPQRTNAQLGALLLGVISGLTGLAVFLMRMQEAALVRVGVVTAAARRRKAERVFHVVRDKYGDALPPLPAQNARGDDDGLAVREEEL